MKIQAIFGRRWVRCLGLAGAAAAGYAFGVTSDRAAAQPGGSPAPSPNARIVAYVYGSLPVTREELGDFLIARGGYEKLDLLVNKRIIEIAAANQKIGVTTEEVQAALAEDLRGLGITMGDFTKHVLPRYNKTLYEWTEDVIKPRILLGKMCRSRVTISEEDLKQAFENKYGEKRQAKIICWNRDDLRMAQKQWDEARKSDADFDRIARMQQEASLASSGGLVAPVGRFPDVKEVKATEKLFKLKVGEMSELFEVESGIMCIKCVAIIPPDASASFEKVRPALEKEMFDRKLTAEIPKYFKMLKDEAKPNLLLKGPITPKEFHDQVINGLQSVQQAGGVPPGPAPAQPQPMQPMPRP